DTAGSALDPRRLITPGSGTRSAMPVSCRLAELRVPHEPFVRLAARGAAGPDDPRSDAQQGADFGRYPDVNLLAGVGAHEHELFHGRTPRWFTTRPSQRRRVRSLRALAAWGRPSTRYRYAIRRFLDVAGQNGSLL